MRHDVRQPSNRETRGCLVAPQVGGVTAPIAAACEVETLLKVGDNSAVHTSGLQNSSRALHAFASSGMEIRQRDPHESLYLVLDHNDVWHSLGSSREQRCSPFRLCDSRRGIAANIRCPTIGSATIPKPTSPCPDSRPAGSGRNPNAAAVAGHARFAPSSHTFFPRRASISAWQ